VLGANKQLHTLGNRSPCRRLDNPHLQRSHPTPNAQHTHTHPTPPQVPSELLVERVVGRRLDPQTGAIYHLKYNPPPSSAVPRLTQRSDDTEEKVRARGALACVCAGRPRALHFLGRLGPSACSTIPTCA